MRKLFYFAILVCFSMSCADHDSSVQKEFNADEYPQKWKLVQMSGTIPNSTATGADMEWQETYVFNGDGTFLKSRVRDGVTTDATGTYTSMSSATNEKFLILTYPSDNNLIGSCHTASREETLVLVSTSNMSSTWLQCDGPGLDYERVE